jgi:hypothetical protein
MTRAAEIEADIRGWLDGLGPEARQREGFRLMGFLAARMVIAAGDAERVATLLYELGDQVAATRPVGRR